MRFILIFTLVMTGLSSKAHAGDDHNHEAAVEAAPHGGTLRDAAPLKAEIVLTGDDIKLFVYDKQLKPKVLTEEVLNGEVEFPKQKRKAVTFKKSGEFYTATIAGISKAHRYDLHVKLPDAGKTVLVDFGIDNIQ